LALFGAFGKYIADSGAEYILSEAHVIEKVQLMPFFTKKTTKDVDSRINC